MAYFSRLIAFLLFLISGSALACPEGYICKPASFKVSGSNSNGVPHPIVQGCGATASAWVAASSGSDIQFTLLGSSEALNACNFSTSTSYYDASRKTWSAPSGNSPRTAAVNCGGDGWASHWDGSVNLCKKLNPCPEGTTYNVDQNKCMTPCEELAEEPPFSSAAPGDTFLACKAGCAIVLQNGNYDPASNLTIGMWKYNGNTCTPEDDPEDPEDPGDPDPPDPGASNPDPPDPGASDPGGGGGGDGDGDGGGGDGDGGDGDGGGGGGDGENPDPSTFCAENPDSPMCKPGEWGGSCLAGFTCSGDAVQCAIAKASWVAACALDPSNMTKAINEGVAAMAAGAASGLGIGSGTDTFDLAGRLSEVPLFGSSGGCPSDVSVSVNGSSYSIPFSRMCSSLNILGVALMAFAYLVAGFIVFRGARS